MQTYNPGLFTRDAQNLFLREFHSVEHMIWKERVATITDSDGPSESYPFTGPAPSMAELTDEVQFTPMSDTTYTLTNTTYSAGLSVKRTQIDDDQINGIKMRIGQMASVAAGHQNKIVSDLLVNGTTDLAYDNESFFGDAHLARADEGGTQDNLLAGSGTSTANHLTDLTTGVSTIMTFLGENGEPMVQGPSQFTVVAPPGNFGGLFEALESTTVSQTTNVRFRGMSIDVVLDARLTASDANDWYLLYTGSSVKPLIFQMRDNLEFTAQDQETLSDDAFVREQYKYKARARYVGGYSYWQYAVKFVNS